MPRHVRNWSKPGKFLRLERDGRLAHKKVDADDWHVACGLPMKRWTEEEAEHYAEVTGFKPVEIDPKEHDAKE